MKNNFPIFTILMNTAFVVLVALKASGTISLSWLWITAPMWLSVCFLAVLITAGLVIAKIYGIKEGKSEK